MFIGNTSDEITPERKFISLVLAGKEALKLFNMTYQDFDNNREEEFIQILWFYLFIYCFFFYSLALVRINPPKFWSTITFIEYLIETDIFVEEENKLFIKCLIVFIAFSFQE